MAACGDISTHGRPPIVLHFLHMSTHGIACVVIVCIRSLYSTGVSGDIEAVKTLTSLQIL